MLRSIIGIVFAAEESHVTPFAGPPGRVGVGNVQSEGAALWFLGMAVPS